MRNYISKRIVRPDEIDAFGHVNNLVYLKWFNLAATEHCDAVGLGGDILWGMGKGWIIKSHEIEYKIPIKPYEKVEIFTEVDYARGAISARKYRVINEKNQICAQGETVWVWFDYQKGLPSRIPQDILSKFSL